MADTGAEDASSQGLKEAVGRKGTMLYFNEAIKSADGSSSVVERLVVMALKQ